MMDESIVFLFYEARPLWTLPTDVSRQNSKLWTDFVNDTKIQFVAVRGEVNSQTLIKPEWELICSILHMMLPK